MPSPFPGMNPYLEQPDLWQDFHQWFVPAAAKAISSQVLPRYIVRLEADIFIHSMEEERRFVGEADVGLTSSPESSGSRRPASAVVEAPAHVTLPIPDARERHSYLEIRDRRTHDIVTVVEVLSPSNKYAGDDRERYLRKREQILLSKANLVEIDLMRGGPRLPAEDLSECDYCVLVSRPAVRPKAECWPIRLREPLPLVPIPLKVGETDASLDLQSILHAVYDDAGFEFFIYDQPPQPRLRPEDDAWARQFVPTRQPLPGNGAPAQ